MSIVQKLTEKPWLVVDREAPDFPDADIPSAAPTGLRVYFAVASVMFTLIAAMYFMRMGVGHPGYGLDWTPTPKPWLLWVNTAVLVLSSVVLQRARTAVRRRQMDRAAAGLLTAGLFAVAFLAGQLAVWGQLIGAGYYLSSNPANAFFYLITALHGLHLLGGLVAWARTTQKVLNGIEPEKIVLGVDLCAIYWHFLLLAWLPLFYLILAT
jgi:cytochrome c oxidase subunit 3